MQTDPIGYEDGMNWYAYVGNDPVNGTDPTGMYGRGKGWKDEDWEKFDSAQKQVASDMSTSASSMRKNASSMKDGETNADGYSGSELNSMADKLDAGAAALNDNGYGGFIANSVSTSDIGGNIGQGVINGNTIYVAIDHKDFSNPFATKWVAGHESLHNAGMVDQRMVETAYKFGGDAMERMSYQRLLKHKRYLNPDHVMSQVYP